MAHGCIQISEGKLIYYLKYACLRLQYPLLCDINELFGLISTI